MRPAFHKFYIVFFILVFASCGGKDKKSPAPDSNAGAKDTAKTGENKPTIYGVADSTLTPFKPFIEKELDKWARSFRGFTADS
ncbi:MAG: hypothetical protein ABL876_17620, partial [Chitinophagaceae bacterium]